MNTQISIAIFLFSALLSGQTLSAAEFTLESGPAKLSVNPDMGGRISSLSWEGTELLFVNQNVENWGSTFWTSPQSAWNWPPPWALDKGPYTEVTVSEGHLIESSDDNATGFKFLKEFRASPSDTAFDITYTIVNISSSQKQAAPWEITRFASGGMIFYPSGEDSKTGDLAAQIQDIGAVSWYKYDSNSIPGGTPKLFDNAGDGWLCQLSGAGYMVLKKFEDSGPDKKAPGENEIEIYVSPSKDYQEMEQQGPYTTLEPGDSLKWEVKWLPRKLPEAISREVGNDQLSQYAAALASPTLSTSKIAGKHIFRLKSGKLQVSSHLKGSMELSIYNTKGMVLWHQNIRVSQTRTEYSLPNLPLGIYSVKIQSNGALSALKWFNLP